MMKRRKVKSIKPGTRPKIARFVFRAVIVVFLAVIVYVVFFSGLLSVAAVNVQGSEKISRSEIVEEVSSEISGKYFI